MARGRAIVAIARPGNLAADGALDVWDLATGTLRRVAIARFIALDPAGRWAVAPRSRKGLPDREWDERGSGLELWDLAAKRRVASAPVEWEHPLGFEFSRRLWVSGYLGNGRDFMVWDVATGKLREPEQGFCPGHGAITPDGKLALCTRGDDGDGDDGDGVVLWDLDRKKIVRRLKMPRWAEGGTVGGLALSPDGKKGLVILDHGKWLTRTSLVWNLASGRVEKGPGAGQGRGARVRWSPDGRRLLLIGSEQRPGVELLPGGGGGEKSEPIGLGDGREGVRDAVFLPDGKRILTGDGVGVMRLASAADGRELRASREITGHSEPVASLSVTRDGTRLLSADKHGLELWDLETNQVLRSIPLDAHNQRDGALMTPDGAFAIANLNGLSLLELPDGKPRRVLVADRTATPLAVSPDGTLVLVRTPFGTTLWEIPSGREVWSQSQLGGGAAFSADQRRIYSGLSYRSIMSVIDAGSGVVQTSFGQTGPRAPGPASIVALAPREDFIIMPGGKDDRAFWGGGQYNLVGRFDLPSGRFAWTIASRHYVRQVVVSPDGRWFVVAGSLHWGGDKADPLKRYPSRVELRATADGAVVDALDLDSAGLTAYAVAFTPDGRTLLVGSAEGPILRFAVTP